MIERRRGNRMSLSYKVKEDLKTNKSSNANPNIRTGSEEL